METRSRLGKHSSDNGSETEQYESDVSDTTTQIPNTGRIYFPSVTPVKTQNNTKGKAPRKTQKLTQGESSSQNTPQTQVELDTPVTVPLEQKANTAEFRVYYKNLLRVTQLDKICGPDTKLPTSLLPPQINKHNCPWLTEAQEEEFNDVRDKYIQDQTRVIKEFRKEEREDIAREQESIVAHWEALHGNEATEEVVQRARQVHQKFTHTKQNPSFRKRAHTPVKSTTPPPTRSRSRTPLREHTPLSTSSASPDRLSPEHKRPRSTTPNTRITAPPSHILIGDSNTQRIPFPGRTQTFPGIGSLKLSQKIRNIPMHKISTCTILVGTNDLNNKVEPAQVMEGIRRCIVAIRDNNPKIAIQILEIPPDSLQWGASNNTAIMATNTLLRATQIKGRYRLISLHKLWQNGTANRAAVRTGDVHVTPRGGDIILEAILF